MAPEADPLARGFPRAPEPFGPTANRTSYVPRAATESALDALAAGVRAGDPVMLFTGPPGIGKTLLLHVLAHRLDDELRVVFLPYAALTPEELCAVVLDRLGAPRTDDSSGMLRAYARHLAESGSALVLLVDDAGAVPEATTLWCCETARASEGAIRCVFVLTDDSRSGEMAARLGAGAVRVRLDTPMTPEETADYVQVQLAVGRVSGAVRAFFDEGVLRDLQRASGGVPRSLHTAAQALLRRPPTTVDEAHAAAEQAAAADDGDEAPPPPPPPAPSPTPGATTGLAPALREEIERLRRDAGRGPRPAPAASRRGQWMAAAFGAAAVVGLLVASATRPFSTWFVPAPPTSVVRSMPLETDAPERQTPAAVRRPAPEAADGPMVGTPLPEVAPGAVAGAGRDPLGVDGMASLLAGEVAAPAAPAPAEPDALPGAAVPAAEAAAAPEVAPVPEVAVVEPEIAVRPVPEATAPPIASQVAARVPSVAAGRPAAAAPAASVPPAVEPVAVNINATPWALIEVDGEPLGETPLAGIMLSPGPHHFRAALPDGRVIEREVMVDPDDPFLSFDEPPAP